MTIPKYERARLVISIYSKDPYKNLQILVHLDEALAGNLQSSVMVYREVKLNYRKNSHIITYRYWFILIRFLLAICNLA